MTTRAAQLARARGPRTRTWLAEALLAVALGANSALLAQTPQSPSSSPPSAQASSGDAAESAPTITIDARRLSLDQAIHTFVHKITHSTRFQEQSLATWRDPLCFAVVGLSRTEGQFVLRRLSQIATAAGAPVAGKNCSRRYYNFYVLFSSDVDHDVHYIYDHHGGVFDRNASQFLVHEFLHPSKPSAARVWQNATVLGRDGFPVAPADGGIQTNPDSFGNGYVNYRYDGGSRLTAGTMTGLNLTLVVIDSNRTNGAKLGQVADYAAMVGLADLSVDSDLGDAPTILRLFTGPASAAPSGLTAWDEAFLRATYHTEPSSTNTRTQIADQMMQHVSR